MKNLMSEELLKQLLNKIASLESRVKLLENRHEGVNGNPDPSYWQTAHLGYQPIAYPISHCDQPQAHPARCGCPCPPKER